MTPRRTGCCVLRPNRRRGGQQRSVGSQQRETAKRHAGVVLSSAQPAQPPPARTQLCRLLRVVSTSDDLRGAYGAVGTCAYPDDASVFSESDSGRGALQRVELQQRGGKRWRRDDHGNAEPASAGAVTVDYATSNGFRHGRHRLYGGVGDAGVCGGRDVEDVLGADPERRRCGSRTRR